MKRHRKWMLAAGAGLAALAVVAVIALPASGTAPAGSSFFAKLDGEHDVPAADPDGYGTLSASFNGTAVGGTAELMNALAAALRFPRYFGGNWDAVAECLGDLPETIPTESYVLFIDGGYRLFQALPADAAKLVEVWLSAGYCLAMATWYFFCSCSSVASTCLPSSTRTVPIVPPVNFVLV